MSHATEGDLHAYLDGALSAIDPDAAERLTVHLARCADCRARLERERAVRDRSTELLAVALPDTVDIPPFEAIEGAAGAGPGRGYAARMRHLAWAASVAVAVGAGWIGHALLGGTGEAVPGVRSASGEVSGGPAATADRLANAEADVPEEMSEARRNEAPGGAAGRAEGAAGAAPRDELPRAPAPRGQGGAAPAEAPHLQSAKVEEGGARGAAAEDAIASGPPSRSAQERVEAGEADSVRLEAEAVTPEVLRSVASSVVDARQDIEARGELFANAVWRPATLEEAAAWLGRPLLAVAALDVAEITVSEVEGLRVVRVRQTLPGGEPIEIVLERPSAAFADSDRARAGADEPAARSGESPASAVGLNDRAAGLWRQVGRLGAAAATPVEGVRALIDGVWVTVAAPVASDSLRAIVSRIERARRP